MVPTCNCCTSEADEGGHELELYPVSNIAKTESDVITLPEVTEDERVLAHDYLT